MEAQMIYYAKDGMRFDDPVKCAEYERTLGVMPGTIGQLKQTLEPYKEYYFFGTLMVWHNNAAFTGSFATMKIARQLEEYTDIDELEEEDLYVWVKFGRFIEYLSTEYDDDDMCEYSFIYSETLDFAQALCMRGNNPHIWEMMEKKKKGDG